MSETYLFYDSRAINRDIPIADVIQAYTGTVLSPQEAAGKRKIQCPRPSHPDNDPSAKIYPNRNKCHCFSCNSTINVIGLVQEIHPELRFPEICKKLIDDFGLNIYDYSNLKEVEESRRATIKRKFVDSFPLSYDDLNFLGVEMYPTVKPDKDTVCSGHFMKITEYWNTFDPTIYDAYTMEELTEDIYDKDGNENMIELTYDEAADLGLEDPNYFKKIEEINKSLPNIREWWKDNKAIAEDFFIGRAEAVIEYTNGKKTDFQKRYDTCKNYLQSKDGMRAAKIYETWSRFITEGKPIKISEIQKNIINTYLDSKADMELKDTFFEECDKDISYSKTIIEKIKAHQNERKAARKEHWQRLNR